jgi:hypothetical protein
MSDYFKRMNQGREFGPPPAKETFWLIVDELDGVTRVCYVTGQTAYVAKQKASALITDLTSNAKLYCNVMIYA